MINQILQDTFNHLLASDPFSKARLAEHSGHSVGFDLTGTPVSMVATITPEGVGISQAPLEQADCVLRGSPIVLARYLNEKNVNPSTNAALGVEIEGDLEFARRVSRVFRGMNIDWTEILAGATGDFTAHNLGRFMSAMTAGLGKAGRSARQNIEYILTERLDEVVRRDEAEQFYRQVDELAADVDRLEQRIRLLTGSRNG